MNVLAALELLTVCFLLPIVALASARAKRFLRLLISWTGQHGNPFP
jgi:hypothetical protein